jgi:hypothetical protein
MSIDTLNHAAETLGGKWVKLNRVEHGVIEGDLVDFEVRPKTFEGKPVLSSKTGEQRDEWVLALRTDARDDADDDGIRKLSLNESAQRALAAAIKESGQKAELGGRVKGRVTEDPETSTQQATYQFKYTPPTKATSADLDAAFGADEPEPF